MLGTGLAFSLSGASDTTPVVFGPPSRGPSCVVIGFMLVGAPVLV